MVIPHNIFYTHELFDKTDKNLSALVLDYPLSDISSDIHSNYNAIFGCDSIFEVYTPDYLVTLDRSTLNTYIELELWRRCIIISLLHLFPEVSNAEASGRIFAISCANTRAWPSCIVAMRMALNMGFGIVHLKTDQRSNPIQNNISILKMQRPWVDIGVV